MGWIPATIRPEPDPDFVRQIRKIDTNLRVVFGYERYLKKQWAIERKMEPERYFTAYASFLESGAERVVDQPIFEEAESGPRLIGHRKYDIAPEYECVLLTDTLDEKLLVELRRIYWEDRNNTIEEIVKKKEKDYKVQRDAFRGRRQDAALEGLDEAWSVTGKRLQGGQASTVMEGTEL